MDNPFKKGTPEAKKHGKVKAALIDKGLSAAAAQKMATNAVKKAKKKGK